MCGGTCKCAVSVVVNVLWSRSWSLRSRRRQGLMACGRFIERSQTMDQCDCGPRARFSTSRSIWPVLSAGANGDRLDVRRRTNDPDVSTLTDGPVFRCGAFCQPALYCRRLWHCRSRLTEEFCADDVLSVVGNCVLAVATGEVNKTTSYNVVVHGCSQSHKLSKYFAFALPKIPTFTNRLAAGV